MAETKTPSGVTYTRAPAGQNDYGILGVSGQSVWAAQTFLKDLGYYVDEINSQYTFSFMGAVKAFQARAGLPATGIWDPQTEEAVNYFVHYTSQGKQWWSASAGGKVTFDPKTRMPSLANPTPPTNVPTTPPVEEQAPSGSIPDLSSAIGRIQTYFRSIGLPGLAAFGEQAIRDGLSYEQAVSQLYAPDPGNPTYVQAHETFKARFPAIFSNNSQFETLSPEAYLQLENTYKEIFRNSLLPPGLFDDPVEDFTTLIQNGVSPMELSDRIQQGFDRVMQSAPEVRAAFDEFFGTYGDGALAALFLDPTPGMTDKLLRWVEEAAIAGAGRAYKVAVTRDLASRLAAVGVEERAARQGFRQIAEWTTLFNETLADTQDFTPEAEGVAAVFDVGDPEMMRALEARRSGRVNVMQGGGGALISEQGVRGLGSAT